MVCVEVRETSAESTRVCCWAPASNTCGGRKWGVCSHLPGCSNTPIWSRQSTLTLPFPLHLLIGICGFLTFGAAVDPDVLRSYPSEDVAVAVARAFIILSVLTSYPILHFCGR